MASSKLGQATGQGKTLLFAPIAQGAAGTTELVAAPTDGKKIKLVSYVFTMSVAGTAKFVSGAVETGAFDVDAKGGMAVLGQPSAHVWEGAVNTALSITTTVGAARGHLGYFLEAP